MRYIQIYFLKTQYFTNYLSDTPLTHKDEKKSNVSFTFFLLTTIALYILFLFVTY